MSQQDGHGGSKDAGIEADQILLYAHDLARMNASRRSLMRRLAEHQPPGARRVLIADDEPSLRLLVSATLAGDEFEILEAATGTEALRLIRSEHPQLVLLDVGLPDVSGLEICRQLKNDVELGGIRVIMLTGASGPGDIAAGEAAGADLYLTKPFRPLELLEAVERVIH